jgi:hypothetical protein
VSLDGALEDRAEDDQQLVGSAAGQAALIDQLVAPLLDLVGVDLLDPLAAKCVQQVGAQRGAVVGQARGLPVAVADPPRQPLIGDDVEGRRSGAVPSPLAERP